MPKSKYPNQIDTSSEIPTVRDNITEIGSDALNSFKSAILAIERTLGVNPQGSTGNTVASRISRALDSNGNLLQAAIAQAGILTGPITNSEVSNYAAIKESKLDLNFPTQILQSQISSLQNDLTSFDAALTDVLNKFAVHVNTSATNRHKALAITVESATLDASDTATVELEEADLQSAFESLYNAHINYTGVNISSENNSHTASQIYFDNSSVETLSSSESVQGAIEDLANLSGTEFIKNTLNLNSNGLIRRGAVTDSMNSEERSVKLINSSSITYTLSQGSSRTTIIFTDTPTPISSISKFDILALSGSASDSDNTDYQIAEINLSGSGTLQSVIIFGSPTLDASGSLVAEIYKNPYKEYNQYGFVGTVRPRNNKSNTPDIQLLNPNSATIISNDIIPESITSSSHTFNLIIDGGDALTISTYDSNLSIQSLDSIVNKINEQAIDNRYNFLAYKVKVNNCYELALSHNIPNFSGDLQDRTLKVALGSVSDGTSNLGLSSILNTEYKGYGNNAIHINGAIKESFGNPIILLPSEIEMLSGTATVSLISSTFITLGIRIGDLLIINDAENSSDNGTYRISSITDDSATLDTSYTFLGGLSADSSVIILRNSAIIDELTFEEIDSSNASILFDIFINDDLDVFYQKRLEIDGNTRNGSFICAIVDISKDFILTGETGTVVINTSSFAYLVDPDGISGASVYIGKPGDYKIYSNDRFSFIVLRVSTSSAPSTSISLTLYGFSEVSKDNYIVARGIYSTTLGRVLGYSSDAGVPALIDKRKTGTVDETIVADTFIEKYIEGPRNELFGSGIIRGFSVSNVRLYSGYQLFDVSAGIALVNGIRREFSGKLNNRINSENNFYVAMNSYGCIVAEQSITNPDGYTADGSASLSPFYDSTVIHLASIESQVVYDLRLFIDQINYKFTKEILVSNDQHLGHFTSISDAVAYAKRFSEIFSDAGTPIIHIREGLYNITSPIIIDFDLEIKGSGRQTIITKTGSLATGAAPISREPSPLETVFYIGNTTDNSSSEIIYGVTIDSLTYTTSSSLTNVGTFINLAESYQNSDGDPRLFTFTNLVMSGPTTIEYSDGADANLIGEYLLVVGFANTTTYIPASGVYGNLIISNCFYQYTGLEYGPCRLRDIAGNTFTNIIATNNIGRKLSPLEGISNFEVFEVVAAATLTEVIETSNITTTS